MCQKRIRTPEGPEKVTKDTKHPGQKKENAERKCCSTRRDAEDQRENDCNEERFRQLSDKVVRLKW